MPRSSMLLLALLIGFARTAVAAAPTYEGTITSPGLCSPRGVALSPSGDVFVGSACYQQMHMERFTPSGSLLGTWSFLAGFSGPPNGVALDFSGNVFVTDWDGGRLYKFTESGSFLAQWTSLQGPVDLAVDGSGNVFVVELNAGRVQKFTVDGTPLGTIGSSGTGPGQYQTPYGIGLDAGDRIYVADYEGRKILRYLKNGTFDMEFATTFAPSDVAVGPDGNVYAIRSYIDNNTRQVYQYSPAGQLLQAFGTPAGMDGMFRIAIAPAGMIYITAQVPSLVAKFQIDMSTPAISSTLGRVKAMYR